MILQAGPRNKKTGMNAIQIDVLATRRLCVRPAISLQTVSWNVNTTSATRVRAKQRAVGTGPAHRSQPPGRIRIAAIKRTRTRKPHMSSTDALEYHRVAVS